jgi:hypothetical protein
MLIYLLEWILFIKRYKDLIRFIWDFKGNRKLVENVNFAIVKIRI